MSKIKIRKNEETAVWCVEVYTKIDIIYHRHTSIVDSQYFCADGKMNFDLFANMNDPAILLQYDPAAVAIRASQDGELRGRLQLFSTNLLKYLRLLNAQQSPEVNLSIAATDSDQTPQSDSAEDNTDAEEELKMPSNKVSPSPTNRYCRLSRARPATQRLSAERSGEVAVADAVTSSSAPTNAGLKETNKRKRVIVIIDSDNEEEDQQPPSKFTTPTLRPVVNQLVTPESERSITRRPFFRSMFYDSLSEGTDSDREEAPTETVLSHPACRPQPRPLEPGYDGSLAQSQLQRSYGRTRTQLNRNLKDLGLSALFGVPIVSSSGGVISHITLNEKWNYLPRKKENCLELWLGEGETRVSRVRCLDPSYVIQSGEGVPIFWACASKKKGGDLCYYVGHFRCTSFVKVEVMMKNRRRQALLKFEFLKFHGNVANTISLIGLEGVKKAS